MLSIDPKSLPDKENYKFLTGSIIPRPVAFVTSLSNDGVLNGAPFSYFNIVSSTPPLISISVQRKAGERKDTARNILECGEFVVHITDEENVEKINVTAASLPPHESEIPAAGLTPIDSTVIKVSGVKEAKIRFECILEKSLELGDIDGEPACDLIIGRVVQYHINEDLYDQGRINELKLSAISRLAGNNYAKTGEIFSLERPK
ncbi:flavin reductase family protein [Neobacillus terrae]|uniref:flavin reductase family protein n=1 Tax=Neobacillus terrae TaxID=3034837 RepID=UPI00140A77C2|nr:flavin reductase family protein [Neobacillus terrae]NHM31190.1 flavin reductase family protein [Neobacillus terrae]